MHDADNTPESTTIQATIHVGASSVSLLIYSISASGERVQIDFLEQSAPNGHDIFNKGKLHPSTIERCVNILKGYRTCLSELGTTFSPANVRLVASNIFSEADNKDTFLNRIRISCGLDIDILDDGEMTRLIYLKTQRRLNDTPTMRKRTTLVIHVGPGNTRTILLNKGRIESYNNFRLGVHRTAEAISSHASNKTRRKFIQEHIQGPVENITDAYQDIEIQEVVLIGYEIQYISSFIDHHEDKTCSQESLTNLCAETAKMEDDEVVRTYQLDYHTAEVILPALEINRSLVKSLSLDHVHIPNSEFERGLLQDLYISPSLSDKFTKEVIRSAESISARFRVHKRHAKSVAALSLQLFDQLTELHQLSQHDRLLLSTAAILHECGGFLSSRSHHKHSQYIILNSDIFGLAHSDIQIIALIARYHRKSGPKPTHSIYRDLHSMERMRVTKLSALLRIADALDHTHSSRIQKISARVGRRHLHIHLENVSDASAERLSMVNKGDLFQNTFGLAVNLVEDRPTPQLS